MKVLTPNTWFHQIRCWFCGTTLLVEKDDIKIRKGDMGNDVIYAECPVCIADNIIHKTNLFPGMLEKIKKVAKK